MPAGRPGVGPCSGQAASAACSPAVDDLGGQAVEGHDGCREKRRRERTKEEAFSSGRGRRIQKDGRRRAIGHATARSLLPALRLLHSFCQPTASTGHPLAAAPAAIAPTAQGGSKSAAAADARRAVPPPAARAGHSATHPAGRGTTTSPPPCAASPQTGAPQRARWWRPWGPQARALPPRRASPRSQRWRAAAPSGGQGPQARGWPSWGPHGPAGAT